MGNVDHVFHGIFCCFSKEATRHTHGHCDEAKVVSRLQEHRQGWMEWDGFIIWGFPKMMVPPKHPKMIIFSRKNPWLLGTTILGNIHIHVTHHNDCIPRTQMSLVLIETGPCFGGFNHQNRGQTTGTGYIYAYIHPGFWL